MEAWKNKRSLFLSILLAFTLLASSTSVYGSVHVESSVDENLYVSIRIENINSTLYSQIKENQEKFTPQTFPDIIIETLDSKNLTNVYYLNPDLVLDDTDKSLRASFNLGGADIVQVALNTTSLTKVYTVSAEWRKFHCNFTDRKDKVFWSLNFTEYFGKNLTEWLIVNRTINGENHPALLLNDTVAPEFDASFCFILPTEASNIKTTTESITFELPLSLNERLLASPYPIMAIIIIVSIIAYVYHKLKR